MGSVLSAGLALAVGVSGLRNVNLRSEREGGGGETRRWVVSGRASSRVVCGM